MTVLPILVERRAAKPMRAAVETNPSKAEGELGGIACVEGDTLERGGEGVGAADEALGQVIPMLAEGLLAGGDLLAGEIREIARRAVDAGGTGAVRGVLHEAGAEGASCDISHSETSRRTPSC